MDFDSYAGFCALSPEGQAEVARRVREDADLVCRFLFT